VALATLETRAADMAAFRAFCALDRRPGLPASPGSVAECILHLEGQGRRPASITRYVASLSATHRMLGLDSPADSGIVRNRLKGLRRRQGSAQAQAAGLRLGERDASGRGRGVTVYALLAACDGDVQGARDAALISLAYDGGLRVSELVAVGVEDLALEEDGSAILHLPRSKTDQEGEGDYAWRSPETMRLVSRWKELGSIADGPLFRRIAVTRIKAKPEQRPRTIRDLAWNAKVDRVAMAGRPATPALVTYRIGQAPLSRWAISDIIRRVARRAADLGVIDLSSGALEQALARISSHSFRVGLTQDLFGAGYDIGGITQTLRYGRKLGVRSRAGAQMLGKSRR